MDNFPESQLSLAPLLAQLITIVNVLGALVTLLTTQVVLGILEGSAFH